jgi:hypothetical protein
METPHRVQRDLLKSMDSTGTVETVFHGLSVDSSWTLHRLHESLIQLQNNNNNNNNNN